MFVVRLYRIKGAVHLWCSVYQKMDRRKFAATEYFHFLFSYNESYISLDSKINWSTTNKNSADITIGLLLWYIGPRCNKK